MSYGVNRKGKKKMEINDSEVDKQHFCSLYIPQPCPSNSQKYAI